MTNETMTILEAAEKWIAIIEEPTTQATPEQKAALISSIRQAVPKTIGMVYGVGRKTLTASDKLCFADAANAIKATMRSL